MGTWGAGNFENDGGAEQMTEVTRRLLDEVRRYMREPKLLEPDEPEAEIVPCNLQILGLLASQGWAGAMLPKAVELKAWKKTYLDVWDGYIDRLNPKLDYRIERRAVLTSTFDNVIMLCEVREIDRRMSEK